MKISDSIKNEVKKQIEKEHQTGDATGGSGHMAEVSYEIDDITAEDEKDRIRIEYSYTIYITTEFTYYPDNPPQEEKYTGHLFLKKGSF